MPTNHPRLCLVRHGETAWNTERRLQGHTDIPSTPTASPRPTPPAASLASERFDAAYSSDLARARQTAEAIAGRCLLTPTFDDRLRERHYGAFQSLTMTKPGHASPTPITASRPATPASSLPRAASLIQFADGSAPPRSHRQPPPGGSVLIVTHGGVLDIVIGWPPASLQAPEISGFPTRPSTGSPGTAPRGRDQLGRAAPPATNPRRAPNT